MVEIGSEHRRTSSLTGEKWRVGEVFFPLFSHFSHAYWFIYLTFLTAFYGRILHLPQFFIIHLVEVCFLVFFSGLNYLLRPHPGTR